MSINIDSTLGLFALISKSEFEPALSSRFNNRALYPKCREHDAVHMLAQRVGRDIAQDASGEIYTHFVQDRFIVKKGVVAFPCMHFMRREVAMFQEI